MILSILVSWTLGFIVGLFILIFSMMFGGKVSDVAAERWYLFTVFWFLGLMVFFIWTLKEVYILIWDILHN